VLTVTTNVDEDPVLGDTLVIEAPVGKFKATYAKSAAETVVASINSLNVTRNVTDVANVGSADAGV
jgi:hypothetical protein